MENITQTSVRLCKGGGTCCPIVEKTNEGFEISDDFGGKVKLTSDEFSMLKDAEKALLNDTI